MFPRLTLPNIGLSVLLAAVIALVAGVALDRSREDDSPITVNIVPSNDASGQVPMGVQAARHEDVPGPGALLMIQGQKARRLVFWPLYGSEEPQVIDSLVSSSAIRPNPAGTHILYSTLGAMMVLDVDARRASIIGVLPDESYPVRVQWSPTGHAVVYVVQQGTQLIAYYTLADGSIPAVPFMRAHEGLGLDVGWLIDGRPVAIHVGIDPAVGGLRALYTLYDPPSGELFPLPPDSDVIQTWTPWQSPDGTQQVYALQGWTGDDFRQDCMTGPLVVLDDTWLPVAVQTSAGDYTTLFEMYGLYMDWPTWLRDGRIVFRGTADEVCNTYQSGLYIAAPGSKPQQLVATEVAYTYDKTEKMVWNLSYAINAAETHVVWSENDPEGLRSTVYLMPLDGSTPAEMIYQTPPIDDPTATLYSDEEMILSFVWLP